MTVLSRVSPHQRLPQPRRIPPSPAIQLAPGVRLRCALVAALADLDHDRSLPQVYDDLRGALAYTAAIGESCMVACAIEAVHEAIRCLGSDLRLLARAALTQAISQLSTTDIVEPRRSAETVQ
ncbi:MAG: hypothetical protein ABW215_01850 [Kibdelosporangium sp.]